ncbi:MAG TPA: helix-turn-helix transcriptional regulator [Candidatus Omnitrophota bacterium]|nr:helix-turn-helix transcriptional regulator [Candidatus Omnitrophota bacterium]
MKKPWLWNINKTEAEIKRILADPEDKAFVHYAALLFSRHTGLPKEIFGTYIRKEDFCRHWPAIKRRMRKDKWNDERIPFWDGAHDFLVREFKKKGIEFRRPKKEALKNPAWERLALDLRNRRRARKITQAELAKKMGVTQQFIAKVESGTQNLSTSTIEKIEKALATKPAGYSVEEPFREGRITEPVTTWFVEEPGRKTESK